ncbi:MAG: prepilin-type N-terminal cleavage/methylation domain-containing protein [Candidatus Omnitrophota bacterium]
MKRVSEKGLSGFTLVEIVVVIVIIGAIASASIPSLTKLLRKQDERGMVMQALTLHAANEMYRAKNGHFWRPSIVHSTDAMESSSMTEIEAGLGIDLNNHSGLFSFYYIIFTNPLLSDYDHYGFTIFYKKGTSEEFAVLVDQNQVSDIACMPEEHYDGPEILKPVALALKAIDDFLFPNAWAPCYIVRYDTPHEVPCCCRNACPSITARCSGTGCGCN